VNPDVDELVRYNRDAELRELCRCGCPRINHAVYCGSRPGIGERCLTCPPSYGMPGCVDFVAAAAQEGT